MTKELFILKLHDIGAVKFGEFTLKSGHKSPFYFDLRDMISYPELLDGIADLLVEDIENLDFDYVSGVPYTALPIATLVADMLDKPLIYIRKEEKAYGTKKSVIGKFEKGSKVLIIDDLITTGESLVETAEKFKNEGLEVVDFSVIIDRSNHVEEKINSLGYRLHSLIKLDKMTEVLHENDRITNDQVTKIKEFTKHIYSNSKTGNITENHLTILLKEKIYNKKSNLILSLDVDNQKKFFEILDKTAKHIVMLKTHVDIINDFTDDFIVKLKEYAKKYDFLIFEDRKFADIGNTVRKQYHNGIYKIKNWAHFITVHAVPGEGILQGLFDGVAGKSSFLLAKMSSKGNLMNDTYTRNVFNIGEKYADVVSGYIVHANTKEELKRLKNKIPKGQLLLMPGVKLKAGSDATGQQYTSAEDAMEGGADCIIVGRGIIEAENPEETAKEYRERAWKVFDA
ncbi:MAG: orotidine 5'-phosphate decarboxylase [Bacteroidetes bacterium]|nr:MAG: orotidine 5'-phosphate decarboxylase [Bacteroidota bacterium]